MVLMRVDFPRPVWPGTRSDWVSSLYLGTGEDKECGRWQMSAALVAAKQRSQLYAHPRPYEESGGNGVNAGLLGGHGTTST